MKKAERDELFRTVKAQVEAVTSGTGLDEAIKEGIEAAGGEAKSMEFLATLLGVDTTKSLLVMSMLRKGELPVIGRPSCHQCREVVLQDNLWAAPYVLSPFSRRPVKNQAQWSEELERFRKLTEPLGRAEKELIFAICPDLTSPSPSLCLLVFCGKKCGQDFAQGVKRTNLDDLFKL